MLHTKTVLQVVLLMCPFMANAMDEKTIQEKKREEYNRRNKPKIAYSYVLTSEELAFQAILYVDEKARARYFEDLNNQYRLQQRRQQPSQRNYTDAQLGIFHLNSWNNLKEREKNNNNKPQQSDNTLIK